MKNKINISFIDTTTANFKTVLKQEFIDNDINRVIVPNIGDRIQFRNNNDFKCHYRVTDKSYEYHIINGILLTTMKTEIKIFLYSENI